MSDDEENLQNILFELEGFNCTCLGCHNNHGKGFAKYSILQQHRFTKHGIQLRSKMSNKVFSSICESIMKSHASMIKQNISKDQLINALKEQYTENTVADVKRELSTFKSKWIEGIDKQKITLANLPVLPEIDNMVAIIFWVKHMKLEDFEKLQIFVDHLLAVKKLRELELDSNFTSVAQVLSSIGGEDSRVGFLQSAAGDIIKSLMMQLAEQKQENERLRQVQSSSESSSSASSSEESPLPLSLRPPPDEQQSTPTSFIGMVGEALGVSSGNKRQRAED